MTLTLTSAINAPEHKKAITTPCDTCFQFGTTQRGGMLFISYKRGTRGFDSGLRSQYKEKVYVRLLGLSGSGRYTAGTDKYASFYLNSSS